MTNPIKIIPDLPSLEDHSSTTPPIPGITSSGNPLGRAIHTKTVEEYEQLPVKEQHDALRTAWRSIAMGLAVRAKSFSTTCSSKDFGKLYQLVNAGAAALDKAFPPKENTQSTKLVFNLFNSLGQRAARIAIPEVPIEVNPSPDKVLND